MFSCLKMYSSTKITYISRSNKLWDRNNCTCLFSATALDAIAVILPGARPFCRCICCMYSYLSNKRSTSLSFFAFLHVPTQLNSRYFFSFFPLLQVPSFILIMRRDTHILLLLFSVLHGHILYQSICKKGRRIRFWHSN